jgi:hypothetical protein
MPNATRPSAGAELKDAITILAADPYAWWAIHTALAHAASQVGGGENDLLKIALAALRHTTSVGFRSRPDDARTRFAGNRIMEWQDALYVVNELPEWRFPDNVLLVGWMVECGGPDVGRGPARASFQDASPAHYVGATRHLYNSGRHGNGPGWPTSHEWTAANCRYMSRHLATM